MCAHNFFKINIYYLDYLEKMHLSLAKQDKHNMSQFVCKLMMLVLAIMVAVDIYHLSIPVPGCH